MRQDRKCGVCGFIAFGNQQQEKTKEYHANTHDEKVRWEAVW